MQKLAILLGLGILFFSQAALAQVSEEEIRALRAQIEMLTQRLDELERQSRPASPPAAQTAAATGAPSTDAPAVSTDEKIDQAVEAEVEEQMAAMSWAERLRWNGDFRYRYENIQADGEEDRNRSRIRARAHLEADVTQTVQVGFGLATGGEDRGFCEPDHWRRRTGVPKPLMDKEGFIAVPDTPGLGIGLNEEAIKAQLKDPAKFFAPTPEWNEERAWDRLWSRSAPGGPPRA